jgi:hypothetical protein
VAGGMICMLLVTWAATYGVNEYGVEEPANGLEGVRERRRRCNDMIREILGLIDKHGLLRKPTWDGVRVLLLIMPLTEDVQTQLERLVSFCTTHLPGFLCLETIAAPLLTQVPSRLLSAPTYVRFNDTRIACPRSCLALALSGPVFRPPLVSRFS